MKFGGASLANGQRITHVAKLIAQYSEQDQIIVVASAMFGVTDKLITISKYLESEKYSEALNNIQNLSHIHFQTLTELCLDKEIYENTKHLLEECFIELNHSVISANNYDKIVSFGERFSCVLLSAAINNLGLMSRFVISSEIIFVKKTNNETEVQMQKTWAKAQSLLLPLVLKKTIPVVTGFFASTSENEVVTLGRGGSDYSATILASVLDVKEVILWKDIDGVYDRDPKINNNATLYLELTYDEAVQIAKDGARILHPDCISPILTTDTIIWIKNTFNPFSRGTRISSQKKI